MSAAPQDASPQAIAFGRRAAAAMFQGRTGHGGGPCLKRVLSEEELIAFAALAYDFGRNSK